MFSGFFINWRRFLGWAMFASCLGLPLVYADPSPTFSADAVKAAYLVNFIRFTEWMSPPPITDNGPFVIGVAGNRELEDYLWRITSGKLLQGRKIRVRRLISPTDAPDCQLIYIQAAQHTAASPFSSSDWLHAVRGAPVLTVGEEEGFLQAGGMINFYAENNNLRFEISPRAAEAARLQLSSRLLAIARIVKIAALPADIPSDEP